MKITVPNNNLRSETQKRVQASKLRNTRRQEKSFNLSWLLFPVACAVVHSLAGVVGTLSILVF